MIVIKAKILESGAIEPERTLTQDELKSGITSQKFDGVNYIYYQNDEPQESIQDRLDRLKRDKKFEIQDKTDLLVNSYFYWEGSTFGCDRDDRIKWNGLINASDDCFPITIVSREGNIFNLTKETARLFYNAVFDYIRNIEETGGLLKYAVNQCVNEQQINEIIDNR